MYMQITDIRIRVVNKESKMKAVVSVTFDDCFVVHDIKVIDGDKGLFIAMPSKKTPDGEYRDIAHPINGDMRGMLMDAILEKYKEELANMPPEEEDGGEI
jgi:stage V sporulation protein G